MKLTLEITIPGKPTKANRKQLAAVLMEVAKAMPNHGAESGMIWNHNGKDCGHYFIFTDSNKTA